MRRMMVTGGAGFIGSNFVRHWRAAHPDDAITVVDAMTYAGRRENLEDLLGERCRLVEADIGDTDRMAALLRDESLDTIVHFAAESHVDRSITGPDAFLAANVEGTWSLLTAARLVWMTEGAAPDTHRFHHVSTDEVYGSLDPGDPAFTEDTPYAPNSPYSATKAASDHLVRAWHHTYGLEVTTSNCSNNYGPYHFPEKLVPLMILNALHGRALPVYGEGRNVRDWLHVEDHARGIEAVLERGRPGRTYNIGGCNEWTNIDIVHRVCETIDARFGADPGLATRYPEAPAARGEPCSGLIAHIADRAGHDFRYAIDASRIERELGFEPAITFERGIELTVDWYLANPEWWAPLLGKAAPRP